MNLRAVVRGLEGSIIATRHRLRFGKYEIPLPGWRPLRLLLGAAFVLGSLLAILPLFGLWMMPVGLLILSVDLPPVRRFRRRVAVWWGHLWQTRTVGSQSPNPHKRRRKKKGPSG